MNLEKNENLKEFDRKKLLEELAMDIAREFGLEKERTKSLIKKETLSSLDNLKTELNIDYKNNNEKQTLNEKEVEKLFYSLKNVLEVIEKSSKIERKNLLEDVEKTTIVESKNIIEKYLPKKLISKAKNPSNFNEHILGFSLGSANSIVSTADVVYKVGKGIIQSPYHLYLIISGKAETNSFKNI